jgi:hypothetical protein
MNKRFMLIALIVVAMLLPTAIAQADYSAVSGELRNSATNALWTYGASAELFNCNTLATIITAPVDSSGVFTITIPATVTVPVALCIDVTFNTGPNGKPGNAAKGPYPDRSSNSGTLNTGVYFTGTGPNAITLRDLNATTTLTPWPLILAAVIVVAAMLVLGLMLRRRTARA